MARLFVLGLLLLVLRLAVKSFTGQLKSALSGSEPATRRAAPRQVSETLVPCSRCGTYVASSRALAGARQGELFCSEGCRRGAPAQGSGAQPTA